MLDLFSDSSYSFLMPSYQHKDRFYHKAKEQGLPSRASFKIEEILKKFKLVKPGDAVIDLGAAPGGWTVILSKAVGDKGKVLALDLEKLVKKPPNVSFYQGDMRGPEAGEWIESNLQGKKCAAIVSDMSPKLTGIGFRDAFASHELGRLAFTSAERHLAIGGHLVMKQFPGDELAAFLKTLKSRFRQLKVFEPEATRKTSKEIYLVAMGWKGPLD